uniref:carboxypeptidase regulatory-like domain-containing protein n=1 Tax=Alistipes sp. TaxID=1872444 RepID=UPI004056FA94
MKFKHLLILMVLALLQLPLMAQEGGVKGRVVSREGRTALGNVKVSIESIGRSVLTDAEGNFRFENLPAGDYKLTFEAAEFENSDVIVRVERMVKDIASVSLVPDMQGAMDDAIFAEFDTDAETAGDSQALPSSLSSSKDVFNNIASYKFSEMRFNVRGYDSQYSSIYLNGIRFNDALTGYGPWSLWSGLNDATRNQENTAGLISSGFGIDGIGGTTNVNARASQMRKGFRASVVNGNSMYRFRLMLSYASGMLDSGWSYAFSFSTRQGGNGYVDGIYYNAFGYFASVEKRFADRHWLALTVLGAPTERGAQQASTQEAYDLLGDNYYNPNVGLQAGDERNTRVRRYHEPIVMLNYGFDISENTRFTAAASLRFGKNGYSALTWMDGQDPRPDYYRYLPSFYTNRMYKAYEDSDMDPISVETYDRLAAESAKQWMTDPAKSRIDFDNMYEVNRRRAANGEGANYMIEERHTDQLDFNFAAKISHTFRGGHTLRGGLNARINRTEYYNEVLDLLGGSYWEDIDKFARRDMGDDELLYQNDLIYYFNHGRQARKAQEGDKVGYDYYAYVRNAQLWAQYNAQFGGFEMSLGGEVGYSDMWREGLWVKGLFVDNSHGDSERLNYLTYKLKGEFAYRFSGAHSLDANVVMMQNAPYFRDAFVSARTRNDVTPGVDTEKIFGAELSYNLNTPWIKARVSGYYTTVKDQTKVISFYDDTQSSFTNFAMSGIDKRYMGLEVGITVPLYKGLSANTALSWGDYIYTSNPDFVQTVDNSRAVVREDKVLYKNYHVESTPQLAWNVGLSFRSSNNWFINADFNLYDGVYLSMNPARRTIDTYRTVLRPGEDAQLPGYMKAVALNDLRRQEEFDLAYTLNLSIGKNWYIRRVYQLGFSLEMKNLLNNQTIRTGGYEQMRLSQRTYVNESSQSVRYYAPFDSKYFYLLGTTYYLNVYFRF